MLASSVAPVSSFDTTASCVLGLLGFRPPIKSVRTTGSTTSRHQSLRSRYVNTSAPNVLCSPDPERRLWVAFIGTHTIGVRPVMLTGDNRETAEPIARELGIDEVIAEALPKEEAQKVKELEQRGWKAAMVGDGVDAPARLGAGRCPGWRSAPGTEVAIETADVVLMRFDRSTSPPPSRSAAERCARCARTGAARSG
jgi:haloacid dehalogenase-like hydrolase